jgi:hypothetical protein
MTNADQDHPLQAAAAEEEEEELQDAAELPEREAMSLLLDPGALLGGLSPGSTATPAAPVSDPPPTPGSDVPTPAGTVAMPHMPVPEGNPGGTYQPDTSATSKT